MSSKAMGKGGVSAVTAVAVALCFVSYLVDSPQPPTGYMGICLPSPNLWTLVPVAGWGLNLGLLIATTVGLYFVNKVFTIVAGAQTILTAIFLLMAASVPWIGGMLTSSAILAPAMLACIAILCSCYRQRNSTQEIFVLATILSLGSMIQYAFIFMIIPAVTIAIAFKCMHLKEVLAMLLGLVAPYWVGIGLGLIPIENFAVPHLTNLFDVNMSRGTIFFGLVNLAVTALLTLILSLYNSMKLYAGNPRRRFLNLAFVVLEVCCVAFMVIDFNNLTAYIVTFYLCCAVQYANLFALWRIRRAWIWSLLICLMYCGLYTASLLS